MSAQHTPGRLKTRKGFHTDTIEIFKPDRSIKKPFYATELATVNAEDKQGEAAAIEYAKVLKNPIIVEFK